MALAPVHVAHDAWHAWHTLFASLKVPAGHDATQVPDDKAKSVLTHVKHWLALAPVHVAHAALHAWHTLFASLKVPVGHDSTHVPDDTTRGAVHCKQVVADVQLAQFVAHSEHGPVVLAAGQNLPEGQHPPLDTTLLAAQVEHWLALAPVHVAHAALHAWHTLFASLKVPAGHDATHVPDDRAKAGLAHVAHWLALAPVHVAHDAWHVLQTPASLKEPLGQTCA